jgi:hypothetical protein
VWGSAVRVPSAPPFTPIIASPAPVRPGRGIDCRLPALLVGPDAVYALDAMICGAQR